MLKLIITASMLLAGMLCQAQVSETREAGSFSEIEISSGVQLVYSQATEENLIRIEASNTASLQQVSVVSDGKRLSVSFKGQNRKENAVKVYVAAKHIRLFKAESGGHITLANNVHAEDLAIVLASGAIFNGYVQSSGSVSVQAGSGVVFNGRIETGHFKGDFTNGAKINLSGKAAMATINGQSGAYCNGRNFISEQAKITSNDASVIITSNDEITVKAVDNGSVTYQGSPTRAFRNKDAFVTLKNRKSLPKIIAMD